MFDITSEQPIRLEEAARLIGTGRGGRPVHISTVLRWILNGQPRPDGKHVRLEAVRIGGSWRTSREALQRYAESLTPRLDSEPIPTMPAPSKRRREAERTERELERLGLT